MLNLSGDESVPITNGGINKFDGDTEIEYLSELPKIVNVSVAERTPSDKVIG